MEPIKVRRQGRSLSITLPEDLAAHFGFADGDTLYPRLTPYGVELMTHDPGTVEVAEDARDYMRRHRNAMKKLAE